MSLIATHERDGKRITVYSHDERDFCTRALGQPRWLTYFTQMIGSTWKTRGEVDAAFYEGSRDQFLDITFALVRDPTEDEIAAMDDPEPDVGPPG